MGHTKGEWVLEPSMKTAINAGSKHIAMVNYFKCGNPATDIFGEEHVANAHLIAAAPDLLEALEEVRDDFEQFGNGGVSNITIEKVLAAIAKAKG